MQPESPCQQTLSTMAKLWTVPRFLLCCSEILWNYKQKLKNAKEKIIWLTLKKTHNFAPFTVK